MAEAPDTGTGDSKSSEDLAPQRELVDYFYLLLERLWIIVICLIGAGVFAQYQLSRTPETFRAASTIEVERDLRAAGDITEERRRTLQTDMVAVIAQKLSLDSLFHSVTARPEFSALLPDPAAVPAEEYEAARQALAREMNMWTSVTMRPRSTLIDIETIYTDPNLARHVIEGMLVEFDKLGSSNRAGESNANLEFLTKELERIRKNLSDSEKSLVIYKDALRIREEIQKSETKVREMEQEYLEKWPPLVQEKSNLEQLQQSFIEELRRITDSSETEYAFWNEHAGQMAALNGQDLISYQLRTAEARNNMLNRDFQTESELYDSLLSQVKRGGVEIEFEQSEFKIVQPPYTFPQPIGPVPVKFYIRYGILGLGGGFLIAFLLGLMDSTVRRIEDVERISNSPVFSVVPKSGKMKTIPLDSASQAAESFRTLRASLLLSSKDAKTIVITSSTPGEGKSTISCNLAATIATQGEKVLLIDLDLRRPVIHNYLGLDATRNGVNDCLAGRSYVEDVIQPCDRVPGLDVMTAGQMRFKDRLPDDAKIGQLLEHLGQRYERIILDTAPVLVVSDTLLMAKHVDAVCMVFGMVKTPRKALLRALTLLSKNETYPIGIVSNFMPQRKAFGQYGYYYSYSGGGYGAYS